MDVWPLWLVSTALGAALACGPEPGPESGTGESTTAPGSSGAASMTSAPSPTEGTAACEAYRSTADVGPPVTITLENQSGGPVWLASAVETWGCDPLPAIELVDADGLSLEFLGSHCTPWDCDTLMKLTDCTPSCNNCGVADIVRMEAGASATVKWPGNRLTALDMTAECASGLMCQRGCKRVDQAAAGIYTISVAAYRACEGECVCLGSHPEELCQVHAGQVLDPSTTSAQLDYPTQTAITVVISPA
ncbi:hypothetical protein OV203_08885 [Nannocystis sp. ILAH1]|uniref:hypothetical protein n=1 Tax=Nannocystis sp. ILAH1 TaxID=2996789 RepID=UPI00226D9B81|nr:hypothetical protein [Nannocystis sp. ILAH1]MCY0987236.1 hypothetical protein [Nannocystis sp. ILAH1]